MTSAEAGDAAAELLARVCDCPVSSYVSFETQRATASAYFKKRPAAWGQWRNTLGKELSILDNCFPKGSNSALTFTRLRQSDWANSWKLHFKTLKIGRTLVVKPPWAKDRAVAGQKAVVIDPGLSFGTGQHPTTLFCLRELARFRKSGRSQSFLDVGTGSGILAISAARLGYSPVLGFDFDPVAVASAQKNARKNRVADAILFRQAELTKLRLRGHYDLICANVTSELLIQCAPKLTGFLGKGGKLVLAGILDHEFSKVERVYRELGFALKRTKKIKEWRSGMFLKSLD